MATPPLPPGYTLDQPAGIPPLPPGYKLDAPQGGDSPAAAKPRTWLDSASDYGSELWKQINPVSAVKGLAQATSHPIDTASSLLQGQGELEKKAEESFKKGDYVEGMRHALNYLIPIIGQQTDAAGDLAQKGEFAKSAGMTTGIAANIAAPEMLKGANIKLPVGGVPERIYQSALKPSTTLGREKIGNIVNTGLENAIPVSSEGVDKLSGLINDLSDKVKSQIQSGSKQGATIDPQAVATRADQLRARFQNQVAPNADLEAISATKKEFLANNPNPIAADAAQTMKQGTYQQLKARAYGEQGSATVEAQKALARGIKEELETQFPEIKGLNAREGQLIGLDKALDRAVSRIDNHQLFGIGTPIAAGAGAVIGGAPGAAAAGILKFMLDKPEFKSKLAIALNHGGKGGIPISAAMARVTAYANQLGNSMPADSQDQPAP